MKPTRAARLVDCRRYTIPHDTETATHDLIPFFACRYRKGGGGRKDELRRRDHICKYKQIQKHTYNIHPSFIPGDFPSKSLSAWPMCLFYFIFGSERANIPFTPGSVFPLSVSCRLTRSNFAAGQRTLRRRSRYVVDREVTTVFANYRVLRTASEEL